MPRSTPAHERPQRPALLATCALLALLLQVPAAGAQRRRPLSPQGSSATQVGGRHDEREGYVEGKWIEIRYGRPIKRGRDLFGPPDFAEALNDGAPVWRAGANFSTVLTTEAALEIAGRRLEPGEYTVFIALTRDDWTLIVSTWPAQVGTYDYENKEALFGAYDYTPDRDVVRTAMQLEELPYTFDQLSWQFLDMTDEGGRLALFWDTKMASVPFRIAPDEGPHVRAQRLLDRPIITPDLDPSIGENIQGPSLIKVPSFVPNPLGTYYLYFADHKGRYIRLAYADDLLGPWKIHPPGALQIEASHFLTEPPEVTPELVAQWEAQRNVSISHDLMKEITTPHIASPDVHVDAAGQRIVMYFHGLEGPGHQVTRVATSKNGIDFEAQPQVLGRTYMRVFEHQGMTYGLAMPGQLYRSKDGFTDFEEGPRLFNPDMRHAALLRRGGELWVFWTQVGEAPERILLSRIDLTPDWSEWRESEAVEILRPERSWEGANAPVEPSVRSTAYGRVNQLRDPAIYEEGDRVFLLYAVAGESGIAIAELSFD